MKTIYFVRHGQSEANAKLLFGGKECDLTEKGRAEAHDSARQIKELPQAIDAIISSSMIRTRETAEIIAADLDFPVDRIEYEDRIIELDDGEMDGMAYTPENAERRKQWVLAGKNEMGVESIEHLAARVGAFAADLHNRPEDTILLVGHGFSGRMLYRILNNLELTQPVVQPVNAQVLQLYPYMEIPNLSGEVRL